MTREEIKKAMRDTKREIVIKNLHKLLSLVEGYPEYEDCISYAIEELEQEPKCKDCKWWKDSDGEYRRGCGAESKCPINTHVVYCGEGYCYMFLPKSDMREVEE